MGFTNEQIERELAESPHLVGCIIRDHNNRYTPERRALLRNRRRRQRQNAARRKRLAKQQDELASGELPDPD